jgi:hypothetical protein
LTIVGVSLLTIITLQLGVKPYIIARLEDGAKPTWYGLVLNLSAIVIAIVWALVGLVIESLVFDAPTIATAVVRGFVGAFLAVFGYEGWQNVRTFIGREKE